MKHINPKFVTVAMTVVALASMMAKVKWGVSLGFYDGN